MNEPTEDVLRKVRQWAERADEDLRMARYALTMEDAPYRLIAYHAQQCAEKYLKAYLVAEGIDFPYTHNIARLLELCNEHGGAMKDLADAEELTPFAVTARYPGEDEEVSRNDANRVLDIADHVRQTARGRLTEIGVTNL